MSNTTPIATTKQIRQIMRSYGRNDIWTNKVKDPSVRHVKCYVPWQYSTASQLFRTLVKVAGEMNIAITDTSFNQAFIVRCRFE